MSKKSKGAKKPEAGDVATNRRARHRFELLERVEAGIELQGSEVKSLREGKAQINEAYAVIERGRSGSAARTSPRTCRRAPRTTTPTAPASCSYIGGRSSG